VTLSSGAGVANCDLLHDWGLAPAPVQTGCAAVAPGKELHTSLSFVAK
jgi:hypothetical protein